MKLLDEEGKKLAQESWINTVLKTVEEEIEECGDGCRFCSYFSTSLLFIGSLGGFREGIWRVPVRKDIHPAVGKNRRDETGESSEKGKEKGEL